MPVRWIDMIDALTEQKAPYINHFVTQGDATNGAGHRLVNVQIHSNRFIK